MTKIIDLEIEDDEAKELERRAKERGKTLYELIYDIIMFTLEEGTEYWEV